MLRIASVFALQGSDVEKEYEQDVAEKLEHNFYAVSGVELPAKLEGDYKEGEIDDPFNFVDVIFGTSSSKTYEVFTLQVTTKCKWIFNPIILRE